MELNVALAISLPIGLGITALGVGLSLGNAVASAMEALGRQPDAMGKIMTLITFVSSIFLAAIAVLPIILQQVTGIQALALGGTSLLIVVNVVTDLIKKIDAQVTMREY